MKIKSYIEFGYAKIEIDDVSAIIPYKDGYHQGYHQGDMSLSGTTKFIGTCVLKLYLDAGTPREVKDTDFGDYEEYCISEEAMNRRYYMLMNQINKHREDK